MKYFEWKFKDGHVGFARLTKNLGIVEDTTKVSGDGNIC